MIKVIDATSVDDLNKRIEFYHNTYAMITDGPVTSVVRPSGSIQYLIVMKTV